MRYALLVSSFLAGLLLTTPVLGGVVLDGDVILFDSESAVKLVEDLRDGRTNAAKVEALTAENVVLQVQIDSLKRELALRIEEARKREVAVQVAEEREKLREKYDAQVDRTLARAESALQRYEKLIEAQAKRIESLEKRQMWMGLLGPIGILVGVFAGAAF